MTNFFWDLNWSSERVWLTDENWDKLFVRGTTVPTWGTTGYAKGCLFIDTDVATGTSWLYENKWTNTSCSFSVISASSGGGVAWSLDNSYSLWRDISVDEWAITLTDASAWALNTMEFIKSWAWTGNIVDVAVNTTFTWNVIDIDMNTGVWSKAIYIDGWWWARTADLIDIKHDWSGNNNAITITATATWSWSLIDLILNGDGAEDGVISIDMNAALSSEAVYIDAWAGTRDANLIEIKNDGDGNVDALSIVDSNTGSWAVIDINMDGNGSGSVIDVDMNAALWEEFLILDAGNKTRTVNLFEITNDWWGNVDLFAITDSNTGSWALFDIDMDWNGWGSVIDVDMNAAVGEEFLLIDSSAWARTANLFHIIYEWSGAVDCFAIVAADTSSWHIFDIDMAGIHTGNVIDMDMDAAVDAYSLYIDGWAGTRTVAMIGAKMDWDWDVGVIAIECTNTWGWDLIDIDIDEVHTWNAISITYATKAATWDAIVIDMWTDVTGSALNIACAGARTDDLIKIDDSSTANWPMFDVNVSGNSTGVFLDYTASWAKVAWHIIDIDTGTDIAGNAILITTAWIRTAPTINIVGAWTDAGTDDHTILITQSAQQDSTMIQCTCDTVDTKWDILWVTMGTNVTGRAISIAWTWARTWDLIDISSDNTWAWTCIDVNLSWAGSGNAFDITYATWANTWNAIDLNMGTNVAGMAISVASAATWTANEWSCFDVAHTWDLWANADVMRISSTWNISSTSALLSLVQGTWAWTAWSVALHIKAEWTNVEAITVENGNVSLGENLAVTWATTLWTVLYKDLTEVVAATNVITAAETGSVFFLNHGTEFVSTLPAPAAWLHYTFIVTASPSWASYTITTNAAAAAIYGSLVTAEDAWGSWAATADTAITTITLANGQANIGDSVEVWCDWTYWYARCQAEVQAGITFA